MPRTLPLVEISEADQREISQRHLPAPDRRESFRWEAIYGGGSDRVFYRVSSMGGASWIVMHYSGEREENAYYADIAHFLDQIGVHAPRIYLHEIQRRWVIMEDLGDSSLYSLYHARKDTEPVMLSYQRALDNARRLHVHASASTTTMPGFDAKLYRWERNYFMDHFVSNWAGLELTDTRREAWAAEGEAMADRLLKLPQSLIHRDFQSQNLVVWKEDVWLIDFQGMRPGHALYDIASLLYDPYVPLSSDWRLQLFKYYVNGFETPPAFLQDGSTQLLRAAAQRIMQALGAFGYLGLKKSKPQFLKHIPQGLSRLREIVSELGELPETERLLKEIQPSARTEA